MEQQFKVKINSNPAGTAKSFIGKMNKSDWVFLFSYVFVIFCLAFIFDILLGIIKGEYIILPGFLIGGPLLRNRLVVRNKKS